MSIKKFRRPVKENPVKPIPLPERRDLMTGLIFLVGSFFNNTQEFDIEHFSRDSRFVLRYRGVNYKPHRDRRRY